MAVYKEEKTNTWRAVYRYTDWNGERKQTQKRGFKTKREAQAWEREQLNKTSADLDMTFKSFVDLYTADMKTRLKENTWATKDHRGPLHGGYENPAQGEHLGYQGPYHPHQAAALLRQTENVQHYRPADYHLAERDAEP